MGLSGPSSLSEDMTISIEKKVWRMGHPEVGAREDSERALWIHENRVSLVCDGKVDSKHCR